MGRTAAKAALVAGQENDPTPEDGTLPESNKQQIVQVMGLRAAKAAIIAGQEEEDLIAETPDENASIADVRENGNPPHKQN
jgi:hypothetical protein